MPKINNLYPITRKIRRQLDKHDAVREKCMKLSRDISRKARIIIQGLHRSYKTKRWRDELTAIKRDNARLQRLLIYYSDLYHTGFVSTALQELSEAFILLAVIDKKPLPEPEKLQVTPDTYLLGLADTIGELRRCTLDALRKRNLKAAWEFLDAMEEIFESLMTFDYPESIVPLRRKLDIARGVIEKTRGELAVAVSERSLEKKIEELRKRSYR
jgi:translin